MPRQAREVNAKGPCPEKGLLEEHRPRLFCEPLLPEAQAQELLAEKLRRMIFQKGFFRIRDLRIRAEPVPLDLHVPYWIGFYDAGKSVRLRVLDAVRRRFEGAKARAFFETWLAGC